MPGLVAVEARCGTQADCRHPVPAMAMCPCQCCRVVGAVSKRIYWWSPTGALRKDHEHQVQSRPRSPHNHHQSHDDCAIQHADAHAELEGFPLVSLAADAPFDLTPLSTLSSTAAAGTCFEPGVALVSREQTAATCFNSAQTPSRLMIRWPQGSPSVSPKVVAIGKDIDQGG